MVAQDKRQRADGPMVEAQTLSRSQGWHYCRLSRDILQRNTNMCGEKLVAASNLSWRSNRHDGQWLVLRVPCARRTRTWGLVAARSGHRSERTGRGQPQGYARGPARPPSRRERRTSMTTMAWHKKHKNTVPCSLRQYSSHSYSYSPSYSNWYSLA